MGRSEPSQFPCLSRQEAWQYGMLRKSASGPEIGLPGRMSAGFYPEKLQKSRISGDKSARISAKTNPTRTKCHRHPDGPFSRSKSLLGLIFPMTVGPARSTGPTDMGEIRPRSDFDQENGAARCP